MLDFHGSDNWADPGKQAIPAAWEDLTDEKLSQAVYQYTYTPDCTILTSAAIERTIITSGGVP